MGRFTDQDEDSYRLPEGMERIGYDADTQCYTFRDASGALYESAPGSRYGELRPYGQPTQYTPEETDERNNIVEKSNRDAVRSMLPFALLVFVFLLVMFRVVNGGFGGAANHGDTQVLGCSEGSHQIQVEKGDTCWKIAENYSLGVEELLGMEGNGKVDCDKLKIGQGICVPV